MIARTTTSSPHRSRRPPRKQPRSPRRSPRRARRPRRKRRRHPWPIRPYLKPRARSGRRARSRTRRARASSRRSRRGAASDPFASTRRSLKDSFAQAPKPKKQAAKKRVAKDESEDEFAFDDDEPAAAPAPRAPRGGGRAKKVNYAAVAGSDSEEDEWANSGDESDGFVDSD